MESSLLNLLCKKNNIAYIIFNNRFKVIETHNLSIKIDLDVREFLWEIIGLEENILEIQSTKKPIEIPMVFRDNHYYDLEIDNFTSQTNENLFIAYMQKKSEQTNQYANVIREINKKTLIYDTSEEKKEGNYFKQINKRLITFNVDLDGIITQVNNVCTHFFNIEKEKMVGRHFSYFFHAQKSRLNQDCNILSATNSMEENLFFHADVIPITNSSKKIVENIIVAQDITYLKQIERELNYANEHDTLTGLANRGHLLKSIDQYIRNNKTIHLCIIDIDNFSIINEEYGAHAGDMLLKYITSMLKAIVDPNDFLYRVYGDTFAILFEAEKNISYIKGLVAKFEENIVANPLIYSAEDTINFNCITLIANNKNRQQTSKEMLSLSQKQMQKLKIDKKLSR